MPMHPRPITPTSGPSLPSVVVRMRRSGLVARPSPPGQAYLLNVAAGLLAVLLSIRTLPASPMSGLVDTSLQAPLAARRRRGARDPDGDALVRGRGTRCGTGLPR